MEPTNGQFSNVYRKGEDQSGLKKRAFQQQMDEMSETRKMTSSERYDRETKQGITGAKNAINLGSTVSEATQNPTMMGGPVSGAALAKARAKKTEAKNTKEKEMKRR